MISLELNTLSVRTVGQFNFQRLGVPVPVVNSITRTDTHTHTRPYTLAWYAHTYRSGQDVRRPPPIVDAASMPRLCVTDYK